MLRKLILFCRECRAASINKYKKYIIPLKNVEVTFRWLCALLSIYYCHIMAPSVLNNFCQQNFFKNCLQKQRRLITEWSSLCRCELNTEIVNTGKNYVIHLTEFHLQKIYYQIYNISNYAERNENLFIYFKIYIVCNSTVDKRHQFISKQIRETNLKYIRAHDKGLTHVSISLFNLNKYK